MPRSLGLLIAMTLGLGALTGCAPRYRIMNRAADATYQGAKGEADRYEQALSAWTRSESLGVRSDARVTMIDPVLGADMLAHQAKAEGRELSETYDAGIWDQLYGERGDRLPFDVQWRFDKLYQPQRVANPQVGWTFTLMDDHGRSWTPIYVGDVNLGADPDAWTGSFRVWFPTKDTLKGPLFDGRTGTVTLRIAGAPGTADFAWKFRPQVGAPAED